MGAELIYGRPKNEYYTPRYGVEPIVKYLPRNKVVWCPFDTARSEYVQALHDYGITCEYSHICYGQDFYLYEPPKWDMIVSNPPFQGKAKILERCICLGKPFALLLPHTCLNNTGPMRLFMTIELQLLAFDRRIEFSQARNGTPFGSGYYCRDVLPRQIIIEPLEPAGGAVSGMYDDPDVKTYLTRLNYEN